MYVHVSTKISSTSRPFPSSPGPLHQNEVKCSAFDIEMIFHSYANKNHFYEKGCVLGLKTQQQEKVKKKNKVLHILGGSNKVYYGKLLNGEFKHCTLSATLQRSNCFYCFLLGDCECWCNLLLLLISLWVWICNSLSLLKVIMRIPWVTQKLQYR